MARNGHGTDPQDDRPSKRIRVSSDGGPSDFQIHPDLQMTSAAALQDFANSHSNGMQSVSSAAPLEVPRKRATVACEVCRGRKTRCDGGKPKCRLCTELNCECLYREPGHKLDTGDRLILEQLDRIEGLLHSSYTTTMHQSSRDVAGIIHDGPRFNHDERATTRPHGGTMPRPGRPPPGPTSMEASTSGIQGLFAEVAVGPVARRLGIQPISSEVFIAAECSRPGLTPDDDRTPGDPIEVLVSIEDVLKREDEIKSVLGEIYMPSTAAHGDAGRLKSCLAFFAASLGRSGLSPERLGEQEQYAICAMQLLPEAFLSSELEAVRCIVLASATLIELSRPVQALDMAQLALSKVHTSLAVTVGDTLDTARKLQWSGDTRLPEALDAGLDQARRSATDPLTMRFALHCIKMRAVQSAQSARANSLAAQGQAIEESEAQLDRWYTELPESWQFSKTQLVLDVTGVSSQMRMSFFACRAAINRPYVFAVLEDETELLSSSTSDRCKICLEASIRQIEYATALATKQLVDPWQAANIIAGETLFVLGASLSHGLAALLPPPVAINPLIDSVVTELERFSPPSPTLTTKADIIKRAKARR